MSELIRAEALTKTFDQVTAVNGLSINVAQGEVLALLGPNGAGKTTTVRILASILKPTGGTATVAGFDVVRDARHVRQIVGHLTEFPGLYLRMRARDYLDFFGELQGMPRRARIERADQLMEQFGLSDAAGRRLGEFSKGMRQKVALIRAMLHSPQVLFLDEPTSAMDPQSAKQVRDAIANLRRSGHTIFLCTHNLFEAESLADRVAIIRKGSLLAIGTAKELKRRILGAPVVEVTLATPLDGPWPDLDGHMQVQTYNEISMRFRTEQPKLTNPLLLKRLTEMGAEVLALSRVDQSLEQVYLKLVGEPE
jgi:ABC-2 type transport system ATP-binding protein